MKNLYLLFLFASSLINLGFPVGAMAGGSLTVNCSQEMTDDECKFVLKRRIAIVEDLKNSYDQRMASTLAIGQYFAKAMEANGELNANKPLKRAILNKMLKGGFEVAMQGATVDWNAMDEYFNVVGKTALTEFLIAGGTVSPRLKVASSVFKVGQVAIDELPKIPVADPASIRKSTDLQREVFRLALELTEGQGSLQFTDPDIADILDTVWGTHTGRSFHYTQEDVEMRPSSSVLDGVAELQERNGDRVVFRLEQSEERIVDQIVNTGKATKDYFDSQFTAAQTKLSEGQHAIQENQGTLLENQNTLLNNDNAMLENQDEILSNQSHQKSALDFLTETELTNFYQQQLAGMNSSEMENFFETAQECQGATDGMGSELAVDCKVRMNLLNGKDQMLMQTKYNESMDLASQTVGVLNGLGVIFNDPNLSRLARDADRAIKAVDNIVKAYEAFDKIAGSVMTIANMANMMSGVGAITSVIGGFGAGGGGPDPAIMQKLQQIITMLENLDKKITRGFAGLNAKMDQMSATTNASLIAQNDLLGIVGANLLDRIQRNEELNTELLSQVAEVNENLLQTVAFQDEQRFKQAANSFTASVKPMEALNALRELAVLFQSQVEVYGTSENPLLEPLAASSVSDKFKNVLLTAFYPSNSNKYRLKNLVLLLELIKEHYATDCDRSSLKRLQLIQETIGHFLEKVQQPYTRDLSFDRTVLNPAFTYDNYPLEDSLMIIHPEVDDSEDIGVTIANILKQVVLQVDSLKQQALSCIGSEDGGRGLIQSSFQSYQALMREHIEDVSHHLQESRTGIESQLIAHIRTDDSFMTSYKFLFNGLISQHRERLNSSIAHVVDNFSQFEDKELYGQRSSEIFKNTSFAPMKRCTPHGQGGQVNHIGQLPFPTGFLNEAIQSSDLKVALASGLIQWSLCFDITDYSEENNAYNILIAAEETYQRSDSELGEEGGIRNDKRVVAVWNAKVQGPAERPKYHQVVLKSYKSTSSHGWSTEKEVSRGDVTHCEVSSKQTSKFIGKIQYHCIDSLTAQSPSLEVNPDPKQSVCEYDEYSYTKTIVKCEENEPLKPEVFVNALTNTSQAWDTTIQHFPKLSTRWGGTFLVPLLADATDVSLDKYNSLMEEHYKKTTLAVGDFAKLSPLNIALKKGEDIQLPLAHPTFLTSGVQRAYKEIRTVSDHCFFQLIQGHPSCQYKQTQLLTGASQISFSTLYSLGSFTYAIPKIYFKTFATTTEQLGDAAMTIPVANAKLDHFLGTVTSPETLIKATYSIVYGGEANKSAANTMLEILENNEKIFSEIVLPTLNSNFELDEDLLVNTHDLERLEAISIDFYRSSAGEPNVLSLIEGH